MLLVEYSILDRVKVINESKNGVTKLKILGKFQKCDEQNNNGRVYPRPVLESQVKAIQDKIDERSLVGALDHPSNDAIHLSQASHLITKLWVEKNGDVMGEAEILSTPNGKIVEALINDGVKIGISSRGLGSVSEGTTGKVVNEDFKLITFDLVSDPSTKGAFPELSESINENSARAQAIISKHKKQRVLMTMLESKIRDKVSEVSRMERRGDTPGSAGQHSIMKGRNGKPDRSNAQTLDKYAKISKNKKRAIKNKNRKFEDPTTAASQSGQHYSDKGRGTVNNDGGMAHPEDLVAADTRGARLRKRKAMMSDPKFRESVIQSLKKASKKRQDEGGTKLSNQGYEHIKGTADVGLLKGKKPKKPK